MVRISVAGSRDAAAALDAKAARSIRDNNVVDRWGAPQHGANAALYRDADERRSERIARATMASLAANTPVIVEGIAGDGP